jgi:hypothetical protein
MRPGTVSGCTLSIREADASTGASELRIIAAVLGRDPRTSQPMRKFFGNFYSARHIGG